jgi:hypothetical protein
MSESVDESDMSSIGEYEEVAEDMAPPFRTNKFIHPRVKEVIVQLCYWFRPEDIAVSTLELSSEFGNFTRKLDR